MGSAPHWCSPHAVVDRNVFTERRARPRDRPVGGDGGRRDRARTDLRRLAAGPLLVVEHLLRDGPGGARRRRAGGPLRAQPPATRARPRRPPGLVLSREPRWRCWCSPSSRRPATAGQPVDARWDRRRGRPGGSRRRLGARGLEPMLDLELSATPASRPAAPCHGPRRHPLGSVLLMTATSSSSRATTRRRGTCCWWAPVGVASVRARVPRVALVTPARGRRGLVPVKCLYLWSASASASTSDPTIALEMVVDGVGMGLTSVRRDQATMRAVPRAKVGVGSAVNDATRRRTGTRRGGAGNVSASARRSRLASQLPPQTPHRIVARGRSSRARRW